MHETQRVLKYGEMAVFSYEREFLHDLHIIDIMVPLVISEQIQIYSYFLILDLLVHDSDS